jgi:hypothetical protein
MKRSQPTKSNQASARPHIIEPRRLTSARGGAGLGISVTHPPLPRDIMTQQHNEALIRL